MEKYCGRKVAGVLDKIPGADKNMEQVLRYQDDLGEVVTTLKQVLCIKGRDTIPAMRI